MRNLLIYLFVVVTTTIIDKAISFDLARTISIIVPRWFRPRVKVVFAYIQASSKILASLYTISCKLAAMTTDADQYVQITNARTYVRCNKFEQVRKRFFGSNNIARKNSCMITTLVCAPRSFNAVSRQKTSSLYTYTSMRREPEKRTVFLILKCWDRVRTDKV